MGHILNILRHSLPPLTTDSLMHVLTNFWRFEKLEMRLMLLIREADRLSLRWLATVVLDLAIMFLRLHRGIVSFILFLDGDVAREWRVAQQARNTRLRLDVGQRGMLAWVWFTVGGDSLLRDGVIVTSLDPGQAVQAAITFQHSLARILDVQFIVVNTH